MPESDSNEFYVGYHPTAPLGVARRTLSFVIAALLCTVGLALVLAKGFGPLPRATFEFGSLRTFEGTISTTPYPALHVPRPGVIDGAPWTSRYHIVAPFKFGADAAVAEFDGKHVRLKGTLVHRDGRTMIELVPESLEEIPGLALSPEGPQSLGEHSLIGEIVDSKCFLGVMNPGNLKPHRACAVRCISGGIPPVLCVRDTDGRAEYFLLVGENGEPMNKAVLDYVALPLEITGEVERLGDQLILRASAESFRIL